MRRLLPFFFSFAFLAGRLTQHRLDRALRRIGEGRLKRSEHRRRRCLPFLLFFFFIFSLLFFFYFIHSFFPLALEFLARQAQGRVCSGQPDDRSTTPVPSFSLVPRTTSTVRLRARHLRPRLACRPRPSFPPFFFSFFFLFSAALSPLFLLARSRRC